MSDRWDIYFHKICEAVASKSPCLSRQIGAVLVRDRSIVSTGFNGPARGYPHCGEVKSFMVSKDFSIEGLEDLRPGEIIVLQDKTLAQFPPKCPRQLKGYKSGEGLVECPAAHAEGNCIANAARIGAVTVGSTLYMNSIIPCKDCAIILVNAGITEVVIDEVVPYHQMSLEILKSVKVRRFEL